MLSPSLVIVDDFHVPGVSVGEPETQPPGPVDRHCPLVLPRALELVQPNRLERTEIAQGTGRIERGEQVHRRALVHAREFALAVACKSLGRGVGPGLDHELPYYAQRSMATRRQSISTVAARLWFRPPAPRAPR